VELFDEHGTIVPKTRAGEKVGAKFLEFNADGFVLPGTGPGKRHGIKARRSFVDRKVYPYEMRAIFAPADLFKIDEPGNYTLRMRFQIVALPGSRGTNRLIRFPPLNYPLFKPAPPAKKP
jgi:hypothetical protein